VPLIPNSTHLTQPLDVSVFRPLKTVWFDVLENWRKESRRTGCIPNEVLPLLLYNNIINIVLLGFEHVAYFL